MFPSENRDSFHVDLRRFGIRKVLLIALPLKPPPSCGLTCSLSLFSPSCFHMLLVGTCLSTQLCSNWQPGVSSKNLMPLVAVIEPGGQGVERDMALKWC